MSEQKTAIELLADAVRSGDQEHVELGDVLVPEQCMELFTPEGRYSVSAEKCDDGPDEDDTLRNPQPVEALVPDVLTKYAAMWKDFKALEKQLYKEYSELFAKIYFEECYVLTDDFNDRTFVMCLANSIAGLFDMLAPWQGGEPLNLAQKVQILRALDAAKPVPDFQETVVTDIIDSRNLPTFWLQTN